LHSLQGCIQKMISRLFLIEGRTGTSCWTLFRQLDFPFGNGSVCLAAMAVNQKESKDVWFACYESPGAMLPVVPAKMERPPARQFGPSTIPHTLWPGFVLFHI
jgi:hypothetical protein